MGEDKEYIKRFVAMQRLPYGVKVRRAERRIHEFYHEIVNVRGGNVHISVGGLDSLTLLYLIRNLGYSGKDIPAIGATVLEHKSIRRIHKQEGVIPVYPEIPKHRIIQEFGFPVISKQKAKKISLLQNPDAEKITFIHVKNVIIVPHFAMVTLLCVLMQRYMVITVRRVVILDGLMTQILTGNLNFSGGGKVQELAEIHDRCLECENALEMDMDELEDKRIKAYRNRDVNFLKEILPVLNEIVEDVEKYREYILSIKL